MSNAIHWKISYEGYGKESMSLVGSYESFSLRQVKEIIIGLRKKNITPPVDKTMPATTWLFLYCLTQFEKKYGQDYMLTRITVEDMR